ncbi:hypothetical protein [Microvirga antarctica]|uniref:hypothetical protein n=1 Tax=Microvirga antarctica TaxID=2819233 RepID=UPI001B30B1F7|nr:hypothetical protein [Microvirga antarctica]
MTMMSDEIANLELEIDMLADAAERCRKIMVVARLATGGGLALMAALVLGLVRSDVLILLASVSAVLAGIAIFGTHRSTLQELKAKIVAGEARRMALIDAIDLRPVAQT